MIKLAACWPTEGCWGRWQQLVKWSVFEDEAGRDQCNLSSQATNHCSWSQPPRPHSPLPLVAPVFSPWLHLCSLPHVALQSSPLGHTAVLCPWSHHSSSVLSLWLHLSALTLVTPRCSPLGHTWAIKVNKTMLIPKMSSIRIYFFFYVYQHT